MNKKSKSTVSMMQYGAIAGFAFLFTILLFVNKMQNSQKMKPQHVPPINTSSKTTLIGEVTCLPRIPGPDGSIMADCVYGFKSSQGEYYQLMDPAQETNPEWFQSPLYTAKQVQIEGILTKENSVEFETVGKITLEKYEVIEESTE